MLHKGKLLVFLGSLIILLYGASAAFYGRVVAEDAYKELTVFIDVIEKIEHDYVETPNMNRVQEGAMQGLIEAIDPYSSFLPGPKYEEIQQRILRSKASSGMVLSKRAEVLYVVSCIPDGPAARAGIRAGDYIVSINGSPVESKSTYEVSSLLRGDPGTSVLLVIYRNALSKELKMELTLQVPSEKTVSSAMVRDHVGLLQITSLENPSTDQIAERLKALISKGSEKLILDLRDCADGAPAAGAGLANLFLEDGMIYYTRNRKGEKVESTLAAPEKYVTDLPVVVLINGSTAGAAEIAAGALKDRNRATILGEKSFGVGADQKTFRLKSGAILLLTIDKFCTPSGRIIQDDEVRNSGILPDIVVPDNETRRDLVVESYYDEQDETQKYNQLRTRIERLQLEKALEVLQEEKVPEQRAA